MRNNYYATNQTRSSSASGDLLLAPADFQRSTTSESTETVRAGKLMPATSPMAMAMHTGAISPTASFEEEDRGVPTTPKKMPPTPPREHVYQQPYEGPCLVPPSAVQQPRLFREAGIPPRPLLRSSPWRHVEEEETSIFRASPLLDNNNDSPMALSREHIGFYSLQRSLAFDDGEC